MKHKILWSLIGSMIVASLILVSCAGGGGGGNGGGGGEQPKYGGTICSRWLSYTITFDPIKSIRDNIDMLSLIFDRYYTAPWEKGPAGTNELILTSAWYPESVYRGEMLESWEVIDLYTVRYKLRQGIHYWKKEPVNGRELTVDDVIWSWLRLAVNPQPGYPYSVRGNPAAILDFWKYYLTEIEEGALSDQRLMTHLDELKTLTPQWEAMWPGLIAQMQKEYPRVYDLLNEKGYDVTGIALLDLYFKQIDRYTFEAKHVRGLSMMWSFINNIWPTPCEVIETYGSFDDWDKVVGTGPWIPQSFDPGSGATFVRNPDYWQYDPLHPENKLPYADELQVLIIEDESTYYAALETAQLDVGTVEWYKVNFFQESCPAMLYKQRTNEWTHCIFVRNDIPPFNDIRVRHACMLAIDHQAIINDYYKGNAQILTWPEQPQFTDVYTPLNQLPAETQELFTYNPTKAKQLLAEAGYPDGFETTLTVYPSTEDKESCQIVQTYLKDIGINAAIHVSESSNNYGIILFSRLYQYMISCLWGNSIPGDAMNWAEGGVPNSIYNFGKVVDDQAFALSRQLDLIPDEMERLRLIKADNVRRLGMMYQILLPTPVDYSFWWPWLKNYHGEPNVPLPYYYDSDWGKISKYLWIDQDLKKDMGY